MSLYCTSVRFAIKSKIADSNPHVHFVGFVTGIVGLCMTVRIARIVVLWAWCLLSTSGPTWLPLCMMSKTFCPPICCQVDYAWTHAHDICLSSLSHSIITHTHAHPQHTNTHTHSHKAADVIILCNLGEWLERLSWSPGSILQKPRHLITKWGHWLGLLRENQMQKRPHNTERVERMRNTINKKLTHTFEFGLRYIVMNRFTDRQS